MHVVFNRDVGWLDRIEAKGVDEYKLAGLLGMTVTEGPALPGPILRGHWRGFTVEIASVPKTGTLYFDSTTLFPPPPEFMITFHLGKSSDVEIGIRHRGLDVVRINRPPLTGARKCPLPPEFGREYLVKGPSGNAVKEIVDGEMQSLIRRLENFGFPEIIIEYSLLRYIGIGDFVERYRDLPGILGTLVEIARHIDSKLTIGLGNIHPKRERESENDSV